MLCFQLGTPLFWTEPLVVPLTFSTTVALSSPPRAKHQSEEKGKVRRLTVRGKKTKKMKWQSVCIEDGSKYPENHD